MLSKMGMDPVAYAFVCLNCGKELSSIYVLWVILEHRIIISIPEHSSNVRKILRINVILDKICRKTYRYCGNSRGIRVN